MSTRLHDGQFVGTLRAARRLDGLGLAETAYLPGSVVPSHAHDSSLIALVLDGAMTEQRGRAARIMEEGAMLYHPAHEPHGHQFHGTGARCFVVQFGEAWMSRMRALGIEAPSAPLGFRGTRATWLAHALYSEFLQSDAASALASEGFALALLGELSRVPASRERQQAPHWLLRAEEMLRTDAAAPPRMSTIAEAVGVHPTHLSRVFRQHFGVTMGEYVRRMRVDIARREMGSSSKPLAQIAAEAGFADQAHFSRVFKRFTGYTPSAYRGQAAPLRPRSS